MANSKYGYIKVDYEINDEVMFPNLVVVRIHFSNFTRFSQVHEFEQPNDDKALNLMNACATAVSKDYPDIVFSKDTNFYQRRARFFFNACIWLITEASGRLSVNKVSSEKNHDYVFINKAQAFYKKMLKK